MAATHCSSAPLASILPDLTIKRLTTIRVNPYISEVGASIRAHIIHQLPRPTLYFRTNRRIIDEVFNIPSNLKWLHNNISGFTTHLMKRIQKGPVRGISFKLQEKERERKDNYVPEVSALSSNFQDLTIWLPHLKDNLLVNKSHNEWSFKVIRQDLFRPRALSSV
ncbi:ribosomal S17-domain-containing protein [Mycena olivaceomarginata]|nr:ribosomal S17-domain-containing protein [Mycena olivaceomarginata]